MGELMDMLKKYFTKDGGPDNWPRVDPFTYPRSSRQTKMLVRNAIRNCKRVSESLDKGPRCKPKTRQPVFICMECEKVIAHLDLSKYSGDVKSMTIDIMTIAQQEGFACHLCGSTTYALGEGR